MTQNLYQKQRPFSTEWLGNIPAHWEVVRLKFLLLEPLKTGIGVIAELDDPSLPRYIRVTDIDERGRLKRETIRSLSEREAHPYLLTDGDLLLACSGTVGKSLCYDSSWGRAAYASYLIRVRVDPAKLMPRFIKYFTDSHHYWQWVRASSAQVTIQNINGEKYNSLAIPVPPLRQQRRIVAYLRRRTAEIDALIQKKQRQITLLKEHCALLISQAVTGRLHYKGKSENAQTSQRWTGTQTHWKTERLKFLLREPLRYGVNAMARTDNPSLPRYIRITDINDTGTLREDSFKSLAEVDARPYLLEDGDLLLARSGTVGKSLCYNSSWGRAAFASYLIRVRVDPSKIIPRFLKYFTDSHHYWQWVMISSCETTIENISAVKYGDLVVPVPPIRDQEEIVTLLDRKTAERDGLIQKIERSISLHAEYRKALISEIVTGKRGVGESEIATGS